MMCGLYIREQKTRPTRFRAEAVGLVPVIVVSGGTPAISIIPTLSGAAVIAFPLKVEGEFTRRAVSVTTKGKEYCKKQKQQKLLSFRCLER